MSSRTMQEEQVSQRLPEGVSAVIGLRDRTAALVDLLKKRKEEEDLNAQKEERKQVLESLQPRIDEFQKKADEVKELLKGVNMFIKDEHVGQVVEKAEREKTEGLEKEAEIKRLKEKYALLMKRKQELQHQMQRHTLFPDFMEQVVEMTKFEDVQSLTGHLEALFHFRDQLSQKENEIQEKVSKLRKALLTLEDQHHLLQLHKNNQLFKLNNQLERTRSEALTWESKWNHIQETAAKKTLLLVQIKMTTLNLYETTDDKVEGEEGVDMNDTETQLDKVKMFILDHEDIVKQHQTLSNRRHDGQKRIEQKRDWAKKHIATQCKKD